jgi:DNA-binding XRE family transcriptional regulator
METNFYFEKVNAKEKKEEFIKKEPDLKEYIDVADKEYNLIKKLVQIRKEKNLTQNDISKKTGMKQQVISRFERYDSLPTLRSFIKYLDSMDIEIDFKEKKSS